MIVLARMVYLLFNLYALGLVIYCLLSWIHSPSVLPARRWLERLYGPFLDGLQRAIGPIRVGKGSFDLSPALLLVMILLLRNLVIQLLVVPL
jgi:uncharacterized protein YggT (Ycf19 family)